MLDLELFAPHLNQTFIVTDANNKSLELTLVQAKPLKGPTIDPDAIIKTEGRSDPFSLLFRGDGTTTLDQGTYQFELPDIMQEAFFITHVGRDKTSFFYEAIFN